MKIGVLGSGAVGETLANGFLKKGHEVMRGSRDPNKLSDWRAKAGGRASTGTFAATAAYGEIVVLAVKGTAAEEAVRACDSALSGKPVIDTTNPIADEPPQAGVVRFFTGPNESLMERLQKRAPEAHFVKAFSSVGNALMVDPDLKQGSPTMFICGNDAGAKQRVQAVLEQFGWEWADMGEAVAARAIEPLCMLWCIPGFREKSWGHAFKLLRS
jgi:8-hydroxy-5-deazaflavin:NADPH oxidoreductase